MASRPRPSLLALFDPLSSADIATTQACDAVSPNSSLESGSDKENLISTTPKGSWSKASGNAGWDTHVFGSGTQVEHSSGKNNGPHMNLLGDSFSLERKVDDSSNLCLVQLADELATACRIVDPEEVIARRPREPLSEIALGPSSDSTRTPQNLTHDKRLINLDTPSTTPSSLRKFAAGIKKCEISTPVAYSPSAAPQGSLRNTSTGLCSQISRSATTLASVNPVHPSLEVPFASNSPSLLSFAPAPDAKPVFCDPPLCHVGSSFEIRNSRMNFSGDLLTDDLSFLERLEDDSLADFGRANVSGNTDGTSPKALPEADRTENRLTQKPCVSKEVRQDPMEERRNGVTAGSPVMKTSCFRRSSSHTGLTFAAVREEFPTDPSSSIRLEMHTPSFSPLASRLDGREQVLAPKKAQTELHRRSTLSRSTSARVVGTVKERTEGEADTLQPVKPGPLRARPLSLETRPLTTSQTLTVRRTGPGTIKSDAPVNVLRPLVSRPSTGRRASVGHALSPIKRKAPAITPIQDEVLKRPATSLAQSTRRLSASALSKPAASKTNSSATVGRIGGARRVPLTANAPLYKPNNVIINETQPPRPIPRATSMNEKAGPQRPRTVNGSNSLVRSASVPKVALSDKAPPSNTVPSSKSRTLGRTTSASSGVFGRTSFMTSSSSSMTSMSRLPMLPAKSTSRIPKPGARAAFR